MSRRLIPHFALATLGALIGTGVAHALDLDKLQKGLEFGAKAGGVLSTAFNGIGPAEERAIGESVALEIAAKYGGVLKDEAITHRVNLIGNALAYYSSRPTLVWRFGVLDSPTVNGFSAPGGIVLITRGLYDLVADNDHALAAVLAHEIVHITRRHALNIIRFNDVSAGVVELVAQRDKETAKLQQQLQQLDLGIAEAAKLILEKGYDPATEYGADDAGCQLATSVGYAPGGLSEALQRVQRVAEPSMAIFSTHPPLAKRIERLPTGAVPSGVGTNVTATNPTAPASASASGPAAPAATAGPAVDEDDLAFAAGADDEFEDIRKKKKKKK